MTHGLPLTYFPCLGSYSQTFARIYELVGKIKAREHHPGVSNFFDAPDDEPDDDRWSTSGKAVEPTEQTQSLRHRTWRVLHHLQGFEGKYALRVVVVTGALSAPGYVQGTMGWWNQHDSWWAVCMAWLMSHTM
jgi:hypothetical protein